MINDYSEELSGSQIALNEYNMTIIEMIRPYTLSRGLWDDEAIFGMDVYDFLPEQPVINTSEIRKIFGDEQFTHLLSYVRMSTGFGIYEVGEMIEMNSELTKALKQKLK